MRSTHLLQEKFFAGLPDSLQILEALDHVPGAMFMIKNLDSRYVYMSRALKQAIHRDPGFDIVGKTDFDLFPRIIAETFRQNDLQVFRHGRPLTNEIHATGFFDHPTAWCYSSKFPLHDRAGKVCGLVTVNEKYADVMGKDAELNRLLPAIDHVSECYAARITVGDLARRCGFSESHFMRIFKSRLKMTPYAFVEQVRMFHAAEALRHGAVSVAGVAAYCGYHDPSSFVKRFRKFTGQTPLKYRRTHQAQGGTATAVPLAGADGC